jgi:hypothetical protein
MARRLSHVIVAFALAASLSPAILGQSTLPLTIDRIGGGTEGYFDNLRVRQ